LSDTTFKGTWDKITTTPGSRFEFNLTDSIITIIDGQETKYKVFVSDSLEGTESTAFIYSCNLVTKPSAWIILIIPFDSHKPGYLRIVTFGSKAYEFKLEE
jgi:hypothetical protein